MNPPLFDILNTNATVRSLLIDSGSNDLKVFSAGWVPQGTIPPYVAWRMAGGFPENYLSGAANLDSIGTQVEVYAKKESDCRTIVNAISNAIEGQAYIVSWLGDDRDVVTKLYVISFDIDWKISR